LKKTIVSNFIGAERTRSEILDTFTIQQSRASAENFLGEGAPRKKRPKISKKYRKIALFASSRGGQRKKDQKIAKRPKTALLSLYLLHLYHV